jgi:autotransporter strand-loop-strand O-heptosyltransferase
MNSLFEKSYPELKFVGRGVVVENIAGMFELGWFYDKNKEPQHPVTIPLQQAATNILRLEYKEIIPKLDFTPKERPIEQKYVCISIHSTAQLKYWDYWQELVDWLVSEGYKVVEVSKEVSELDNLTEVLDKSLPSVMNYLHHAEFYIGLSSGISWLAWAMQKKVFMIANFSTKDHEFQTDCIRITDESVCHGCWNNPAFRFNKGDFFWCPNHEDTPQAFECHKSISAQRVIEEIKKAG